MDGRSEMVQRYRCDLAVVRRWSQGASKLVEVRK